MRAKTVYKGEKKIKELESELNQEKLITAEIVLKQQQEIDSLKKVANPLEAPIASVSADISLHYAVTDDSKPGNSLTFGATQIFFGGNGNAALLIARNNGFTSISIGEDKTGMLTATCTIIPGQYSPYVGKPISSLQDAQFIQIDSAAIPQNSSILDGSVRWVINGLVSVNFDIPAQKADGTHITIGDLKSGLKQLSLTPNKSPSPP